MKQIRQGDLFMIEAGQIDLSPFKAAKNVNKITLLDGEATGHVHQVTGGDVATFYPATDLMEQLFKKSVTVLDDDVQLLGALQTGENAVTHQEHGTIQIGSGIHWVLRQREYTPQAIRRVMD